MRDAIVGLGIYTAVGLRRDFLCLLREQRCLRSVAARPVMASFKWSSGLQLAAAPEDNVIQSPAALTFRCQLPRPQSMLPPFASVALAIGKRFATEPKTGIDFPTEICHRTKTACPSLNGIGYAVFSVAALPEAALHCVNEATLALTLPLRDAAESGRSPSLDLLA